MNSSGFRLYGLYGAVVAIVLPGEPDMVVVAGLDAAVGDGDAMGVAAEIGENLRGSAEGLLGVDDPIEATHGGQMRGERGGIGQIGEIAEESEALRVEGGLHAFEEQAAEQPGKRLDRQKEVRAPRDPSGAIDGKSAAGDDAMDVRVVRQRLPPSVQDGQAADPRSEPAVIGGQRGQGLNDGFEQDRIHSALVLEGDGRDWRGQREHDVEIGNRQQFGLPIGQPLRPCGPLTLWTMPIAARVVGDARRAAIVASLDMAAERRRSARCDRAHDAPLGPPHMSGAVAKIGLAMTTQDIRDFDCRSVEGSPGAGHRRRRARPSIPAA